MMVVEVVVIVVVEVVVEVVVVVVVAMVSCARIGDCTVVINVACREA